MPTHDTDGTSRVSTRGPLEADPTPVSELRLEFETRAWRIS